MFVLCQPISWQVMDMVRNTETIRSSTKHPTTRQSCGFLQSLTVFDVRFGTSVEWPFARKAVHCQELGRPQEGRQAPGCPQNRSMASRYAKTRKGTSGSTLASAARWDRVSGCRSIFGGRESRTFLAKLVPCACSPRIEALRRAPHHFCSQSNAHSTHVAFSG